MTTETFPITQRRVVEAKSFYADRTDLALKACEDEKFEASYMPEIIDARISAPRDSEVWQNWYCAPSIKATGNTKQGTPIVVYAHVPNEFSTSQGLTRAINQGLRNRAGILSKEEFQRLLDLEDNQRVFVVDYNALKNSTSDVVKVSSALKHPQTIPFLGGKERAEVYLPRHEEVYGKNIGVWHLDDLQSDGTPVARLLFVGVGYFDGLLGSSDLGDGGRFLGVREGSREATQKISPNSELLQKVISDYVAPVNQADLKARINSLFK